MDENKRYKKYLNNSHKNRNKNISKTKKNISKNNKVGRNDEYKRLLQKPYYSKKANTFTHFKNPLFSHINSLIYKIEINYDEFSYIYKPYLILFLILTYVFFLSFYNLDNSDDYSFYNKNNNFEINKYHNQNNNLIKIGYYYDSIKFGGVERVLSLLINYLSKEKYFSQCLITNKGKSDEEFSIPESVGRIVLLEENIDLYQAIERENIDILIYNYYNQEEIEKLNQLDNTKVIYYDHSSFLIWVYLYNQNFKQKVYQAYKKCKYVISLIPLENDYLFKKWGINSILMDNPSTFEYDLVKPSDLSQKNIIMIGREDYLKRYDLGIKAMKNIVAEIPECKMNIISSPNAKLERLIRVLNIKSNVKFLGFRKNIEAYLKNSSLHIFPSLTEAYPMVLSETKIYGIPTIICGLDFLALAKGGTVIIYDDNPDTIAKEAIKILKDDSYRKKLGKEARESMIKHKNDLIIKRWVKFLLAVRKGDDKSFQELSKNENKMSEEEANKILNNQFELLKRRKPRFRKFTFEKFKYLLME